MSLTLNSEVNSPSSNGSISNPHSDGFVVVGRDMWTDESLVPKDDPKDELSTGAKASNACLIGSGTKDVELLEKITSLTRENEELKGILKQNNELVQQYFQDLTKMQQGQKETRESLKKEHNKAKNVVLKLRERNMNLKNELEKANGRIEKLEQEEVPTADTGVLKEKIGRLESEKGMLQSHITMLQDQISGFDKQFKDCESMDVVSENWKQFFGSFASVDIGSNVSSRNKELEEHAENMGSLKEKYAKLEMEKEFLNVDFDKLTVEKQHVDEQLQQLAEERNKLLNNITLVEEERLELNKKMSGMKEKYTKQEEQLCQLTEEHNKLLNNVGHLKEEKQEQLYMMMSGIKEKENKQVEEKQLFNATVRKLEENIARLQKEAREEREKLAKVQDCGQEQEIKAHELKDELEAEKIKTGQLSDEKTVVIEERERYKKALQDLEAEHECAKVASERLFGVPAGEEDLVFKQKFDAMRNELLKYQKRRNEYEQRLNSVLEKELAIKEAEKRIDQEQVKLVETRQMLQAELESHMQTYNDQMQQLHSELEAGRGREESLREQACQLMIENESLETKLNEMAVTNSEREAQLAERMDKIADKSQVQQKEGDSIIELLKMELTNKKDHLKRSQEQFMMAKGEYDTLFTQHAQVVTEYEEMMRNFQSNVDNNMKKQKSSNAEVLNLKAHLDRLNAQLICADEAIQKRDEQLRFQSEKLEEMQPLVDSVPVLQQQLEVYRNDFRAEREARERQHDELLRLREQSHQLRANNQTLQDDLDNITRPQMEEMQRRHGNQVPVTTAAGYVPGAGSPHSGGWYDVIPGAEMVGNFFRRGGEPAEDPVPGSRAEQGIGGDRLHYQVREPEEPWVCHGCRRVLDNFDELQRHVAECDAARHGNGPPQPGRDTSRPECPKCGNFFPDLDTLQIHVLECLDS